MLYCSFFGDLRYSTPPGIRHQHNFLCKRGGPENIERHIIDIIKACLSLAEIFFYSLFDNNQVKICTLIDCDC